ncbi:MAG: GTPase [Thermoguttaceae bacterium]
MNQSQLRVVRLTPPGRGAVATLLVEGPTAINAVAARFRAKSGRRLTADAIDRLVFGRFGPKRGEEGPSEEMVVRCHRDGSVELHCHGGHATVAMVEAMLLEQGCEAVAWQDWVARGHEDPIAAAAHRALAEARTERTASILLDQYGGALRRALDEIEESLRLDDAALAHRRAEALLARADLGRHLVRPWRVMLAGRPNVGKSSLINALVGYRRAIVHEKPGTTRDVVTATTAVDGWPVELSDTAGLCSTDDAMERAGIALAREQLRKADLVILVFDAGRDWSQADQVLLESTRPQSRPRRLVVHNKCDLSPAAGSRPPGLSTSATTGTGIESLVRTIAAHLVPDPPEPGTAVPFTAEQIQQVACLAKQSRHSGN